jgi:hypothetical protein
MPSDLLKFLVFLINSKMAKEITTPAPGSHEVEKKQNPEPFFDVYKSGE